MEYKNVTEVKAILVERIRLGMKYLDRVLPGWEWKIDTELLDLNSGTSCILGQAYGNFWNKVLEYGESPDGEKMSEQAAENKGFILSGYLSDTDWGYDVLTRLWVKKVKELRKARLAVRV